MHSLVCELCKRCSGSDTYIDFITSWKFDSIFILTPRSITLSFISIQNTISSPSPCLQHKPPTHTLPPTFTSSSSPRVPWHLTILYQQYPLTQKNGRKKLLYSFCFMNVELNNYSCVRCCENILSSFSTRYFENRKKKFIRIERLFWRVKKYQIGELYGYSFSAINFQILWCINF